MAPVTVDYNADKQLRISMGMSYSSATNECPPNNKKTAAADSG